MGRLFFKAPLCFLETVSLFTQSQSLTSGVRRRVGTAPRCPDTSNSAKTHAHLTWLTRRRHRHGVCGAAAAGGGGVAARCGGEVATR
jgi:hypothetical protein